MLPIEITKHTSIQDEMMIDEDQIVSQLNTSKTSSHIVDDDEEEEDIGGKS
jgi:hypothetical protein